MFRAVWQRAGLTGILAVALIVGVAVSTTAVMHAQQQFELYVAAFTEGTNQPAVDLTAADILMTEDGEPGRVVRLERYSLPVKLTILIDNGVGTTESLVHYRNGLRSLLEALPGDLEVGVIALAPNPRWLARPTTNRVDLLRSVQLLTPDTFPARFSDALIEYAQRLDRELRGEAAQAEPPFMPVLVALSTTGLDGSQARLNDLRDMLESLGTHRVRTFFAMLSRRGEDPRLALAEGSQIFVARAVQDLTHGQYEALAASSRVATLLPEWGEQIAMTHRAGTNQYRVTLERPAGASGPLNQLAIYVKREGYYGVVTADGWIP
jgi:hypothetical protein